MNDDANDPRVILAVPEIAALINAAADFFREMSELIEKSEGVYGIGPDGSAMEWRGLLDPNLSLWLPSFCELHNAIEQINGDA